MMSKKFSFGTFGTIIILFLVIGMLTSNTKSDTPVSPRSSYKWIDSDDSCQCFFSSYKSSVISTTLKIIGLNESKTYILEGGSDLPTLFTGIERTYHLFSFEEEDFIVKLGEVWSNTTVILLDTIMIVVSGVLGPAGIFLEGMFPVMITVIFIFSFVIFFFRGIGIERFLGFESSKHRRTSSSSKKTEDNDIEKKKRKEDNGRCSKCGITKEDDDKYCLNCGHELKKNYKHSKDKSNNDSNEYQNEKDTNPLPFTNPDNKILNHFQDSDSDGTVDSLDIDDDNDGLPDVLDWDDDNDGIPDTFDWD